MVSIGPLNPPTLAPAAQVAPPELPAPPAGLTDDPITPERPPWIAPPLPPQLQRTATQRARHRRKLIAAVGVGLVVAGLAAAAVWWSIVPEIRMEPAAERAGAPQVETAPPQVVPGTPAAVEPAATTPPSAMPASAAASATPTSTPTVPDADSAQAPVANPNPIEAAASTPEPGTGSSAPVANSSARPVHGAVAAPDAGPRAACADRTEFALYRCMQQQCEAKRWATHPQCIRLRLNDRVD